jgi:(1->4)-alpha-D-glucan 1-alpha-D-glucosylmutase
MISSMTPTATYRIQFRNGMTFDHAAALVPYLKRLGISHLYASPIFTATSGSTHGYDVTDANEIDPVIGGREGFDRMVEALKAEGLGLILDIVPNHMAASLENRWWRDVVEHGEKSRYARHFDIDWSRRLTLPFLGETFEKVLDAGEISVRPDPETGKPALAYYETFYPLDPESFVGSEEEVLQISDRDAIAELHDQQPYRLMSWRDAPRDLSYRRFFEITGLAGVRVEEESVFDDTHRLILDLVRSGIVDGLRVDHVDGLADPKAYLARLRREAGPDCYITVEKILGEGEDISPDWPISGTTGYEFIASLSDALVDGEKLDALKSAYAAVAGSSPDMQAELRAAKLLMVNNNFAGELATLVKLALSIHEELEHKPALSSRTIRDGLRELLVAFPVYRTYGTTEGMPPEGRQMLERVIDHIRRGQSVTDIAALPFLTTVLNGDLPASVAKKAALFRTRFQQLTGPLMAKSVEDTLFFRHHALLALNEVGAEPLPREFSLARFHDEMADRQRLQPHALSSTSTHDTKRGEDARGRLYALSEAPQVWLDAVQRWRQENSSAVTHLKDGPAPEPAVEWMLYQALAGVWPTDLTADDAEGLKALEQRFHAYVEKALREAKLRTNWSDANAAYEKAVHAYVDHMLSPQNQAFIGDFATTVGPFIRAGCVNSLTQTLVKLAAPGVPDIYQGSEASDLSLVDPDNRREPDFETLARQLAEPSPLNSADEQEWLSGRLKQQVVARTLGLRRDRQSLFLKGAYLPLEVTGKRAKNIIAFARHHEGEALIVIVPRLVLEALNELPGGGGASWAETSVRLPAPLSARRYRDILTGRAFDFADHAAINWAFAEHPFALLLAE